MTSWSTVALPTIFEVDCIDIIACVKSFAIYLLTLVYELTIDHMTIVLAYKNIGLTSGVFDISTTSYVLILSIKLTRKILVSSPK